MPVAQAALKADEAKQKELEAKLAADTKAATDAQLPLRSVAFSTDGKTIVAGGDDKLVHTYNGDDGTAWTSASATPMWSVQVAFAGEKLISVSADKNVFAWTLYPEWTWVRTIGDPASETIVDRVTGARLQPRRQAPRLRRRRPVGVRRAQDLERRRRRVGPRSEGRP